jgi:ferredoxin
MPERYHIQTKEAPPRFRPVGRLGIVDWREDCAGCHNCVKRACVYGLYRNEADYLKNDRKFLDYVYQCKGCMNCVQNCTKGLLTRIVNPAYEQLGDEYYTPEVIQATWAQAETGKIPVSGAGYRGPFAGRGFDAMWTDMSEIVRPTRDGIHGREYISTMVDIGRKEPFLKFDEGQLAGPVPPLIESPAPVIFDRIPLPWASETIYAAAVEAAGRMDLLAVVPEEWMGESLRPAGRRVVPLLSDTRCAGISPAAEGLIQTAQMVEIGDSEEVLERVARIKSLNPDVIVAIRIEAAPGCADRIGLLAQGGAEAVHVAFDAHGRERNGSRPSHARTVLREIHKRLIELRVRDQVTLISSGGIALAEHMAKAIICGADLVGISLPLIIALECRLCRGCEKGDPCPVELQAVDRDFAVRRMTNLIAAWHAQLLEVMGAMGMREVRRLRGETGRAMFRGDLEREIFAPLFGKR